MAYFNDRISAVYTCSLDAEGAFGAIPHVVVFGKLNGIEPYYAWRVMYAWYRQMYVTIMLHGALRYFCVQRIQATRDHQTVNLLKRCLVGSSAASTFYWSLIHNRDSDDKWTLVNKLNLQCS